MTSNAENGSGQMQLFDDGRDRLAMTNEAVARLTKSQREARIHELIEQARDIVALGIEKHSARET